MLSRKNRSNSLDLDIDGGINSDAYEDISTSTEDAGEDLSEFGRKVIERLLEDSLPPFPSYYQLYFDKLLDEQSEEFKKQITQMQENESSSEDEKRMRVEQQLQQGFTYTKQILQNITVLYKNINAMINIGKKRIKDAQEINNPSAIKNLTLALNKDLEKLILILNKQAVSIKDSYSKSLKIIKEIEGETIYDAEYGLFNKRYLMSQIKNELSLMQKFNYQSTLVLTRISSSMKKQLTNKQASMINRTFAKLFLKTSRRSDIVAHIGNGIFAMLLKHTNIDSAKFAAKRLSDMTTQSHFFIGDKELSIDIKIGITALNIEKQPDEILKQAYTAMDEAEKKKEIFSVADEIGVQEE